MGQRFSGDVDLAGARHPDCCALMFAQMSEGSVAASHELESESLTALIRAAGEPATPRRNSYTVRSKPSHQPGNHRIVRTTLRFHALKLRFEGRYCQPGLAHPEAREVRKESHKGSELWRLAFRLQ